MGYRSMLSAVFKSILPAISISPVLHVLLRSFQAEAPIREVRPPSWDLNIVSSLFLRSSSFQPWTTISLRFLPVGRCFCFRWLPQRGGFIQALSRRVSFSSSAAGLSYVPELVASQKLPCGPFLAPLRFHLSWIFRRVCLRTYYGVLYVRFQSI